MSSPSAATLRLRYIEQAASDLEANRRRQQELTEQIRMLKQEEALLVDILALAERHEASTDTPPPTEQAREPQSAATGARPGKGTLKTRETLARGKSPQPLLGDLLTDLLGTYAEPRPAKELRDELMEKHPDRTPSPQVVRNTLESLVAKGRIRRHKRKRSVTYSLVKPAR
ncbi:hypothetical protein [Streptomyces sp. NPDC001348]